LASATDPPTVEEIRTRVRLATGFEAFQKLSDGIVIEGKAEQFGIPGRFRMRLSPDGRYTRVIEAKGEHVVGYTGKLRWGRNFSGPVVILELDEADRDLYLFGILCQRWLRGNTRFNVAFNQKATTGDRVSLSLTHPKAWVAARLDLDRATWLPVRLTVPGAMTTRVVEFSEYRELAGTKVPTRVTTGPNPGGQRLTGETLTVGTPPTKTTYAPTSQGPEVRFDLTAPAELETKRVDSGRLLLVRPVVNGRVAPWFVFDTGNGASTLITASAADQFALPSFGGTSLAGVGRSQTRFRQTKTFGLGRATFPSMVLGELPPEVAEALTRRAGVEVAGTIGWDVLASTVAEVDLYGGVISLHPPSGYRPPREVVWELLHLNSRMPCVRGVFEGKHHGLFLLDTGHEAGLSMHALAVRRLDLLSSRKTTSQLVTGVGGSLVTRRGNATEFQALGRTVRSVETNFVTRPDDAPDDPYTLGTFGLTVLGQGTVVFDYPGSRIAFIPKP
jgi:hypothetical protein